VAPVPRRLLQQNRISCPPSNLPGPAAAWSSGVKTDSLSVACGLFKAKTRDGQELREVNANNPRPAARIDLMAMPIVAPRTVEIDLREGVTRRIEGDRVFPRPRVARTQSPEVPRLAEATP